MYVRIVRGQTQPGQVDELSRRWQEFIGARLQQASGFRQAYFAADRTANTTVGVSLWDTLPDEATLTQMMQEFRERVKDISAGPPTVEDYEVLAQV